MRMLPRARPLLVFATGLVGLGVTGAGCSSEDPIGGNSSEVTTGRWTLPAEVRLVGGRVRNTYDEAPRWTGTSTCSGALTRGARELGTYLRGEFDQVSSIGGYACRRNTADSSRMSVHGTGRALDVFIPKRAGKADSTKGDPVANWLVLNAARIGVQLVIWNRTVWRANGTNEGNYTGPNPHTDHLHVELTVEASKLMTPWFREGRDGSAPMMDATAPTSDASATNDASTAIDAGPKDAGKDAAKPDSGTTPKPDSGTAPKDEDAAVAPEQPEEQPEEENGSGSSTELPDGDGPGEEDSLGDGKKKSSGSDDDAEPKAGCSQSSTSSRGATGSGLLLAVACAIVLVRRRSRTDR
jgi:hypothetical protein